MTPLKPPYPLPPNPETRTPKVALQSRCPKCMDLITRKRFDGVDRSKFRWFKHIRGKFKHLYADKSWECVCGRSWEFLVGIGEFEKGEPYDDAGSD